MATFKKKAAYVNELDLTTASLASATSIIISGTWNTTDFTTLRNKLGKQVLTSVEVDEDFFALDGTTLNSVFANCAVLGKADLRNLGTVGTSSLLTNCIKLRYINISEGITGSTNDFAGVTSNLLIYGTTECPTAWIGKNYIKNGTASSIVLEHGAPFYCPEAFTATEISYTRSFTKIRGSGTAAGYESLVFPFPPYTFTTSGD